MSLNCKASQMIAQSLPRSVLHAFTAWDVGVSKVCIRHGAELTAQCGHCQHTNVRSHSNFVVPGWFAACDNFLGYQGITGPKRPESDEYQVLMDQSERIGVRKSIIHHWKAVKPAPSTNLQ